MDHSNTSRPLFFNSRKHQSGILVWKYLRTKLATWQYLVYWLIILCLKLVWTQLFRLSWRQAEPWMDGATKGSLLLENETPHLSLRTSVCIKGTFVATFKSLLGQKIAWEKDCSPTAHARERGDSGLLQPGEWDPARSKCSHPVQLPWAWKQS